MDRPGAKTPGGNELLDPRALLERVGVGTGSRVADLGCGSMAYFVLEASRLVGTRGQVYAVDVVREVLSNVQGRLQLAGATNVKTVWSDLERVGATDIPPASLDVDLIINTLFQTKDHAAVVAEAARLLRPGGTLLVVEWKPIGTPFGPAMERRVSPGLVAELAGRAGLQPGEQFEAGPYHFALTFTKPAVQR
jgi:ubiquinone/menaquinone biosynthesis C-methylase UbiE